jgi:hypothetical protein
MVEAIASSSHSKERLEMKLAKGSELLPDVE